MPLLLSHNSALERLRAVPPQVDTAKPVKQPLLLDEVSPARYEITKLKTADLGICQEPVHHLVSSRADISKSARLKTHRTKLEMIPGWLVREVKAGIYAAGPELCFIQMASEISLLGAVVLGHELCGSYSHFFRLVSGFYERRPLTTVAKIEAAIQQLDGMHGLNNARMALRWVRNCSASPMETVVSCMLALPTSMGGFGFVLPTLNYKVELDEAAQRITKTEEAKIDTAYENAMCGLEYDGWEYHRDAEKDRVRREALAHMGWTIYVANVDEGTDWEKLRDKVALMDKVPRQGRGSVDEKKGRDLLKRLLNATRCGIGLNDALFGVKVPRRKVTVHV